MSSNDVLKTLCVGNVYSGKTSVIKRYVRNAFNNNYSTTIGVDFMLKSVNVDGSNIKVQMWDIAGQDRFTGLSRAFYTHALGAIVVFDLMDRASFESTQKWKKDIDEKIELPNCRKIPVLLLGNKCDLVSKGGSPAAVSNEAINAFVEQHGFYKYYPTSALDGTNVHAAIDDLVEEIVRRLRLPNLDGQGVAPTHIRPNNVVDLEQKKTEEDKSGCC